MAVSRKIRRQGKIVEHAGGVFQVVCPFCRFGCDMVFIFPCECGVEFSQDFRGRWWFDKSRKVQATSNATWAAVLLSKRYGDGLFRFGGAKT